MSDNPVVVDSSLERRQSRLSEFKRRLFRNKAAVCGLCVVLLLVVLALFAPIIAPFQPNEMNMLERLSPPSPSTGLGRITLAEIF